MKPQIVLLTAALVVPGAVPAGAQTAAPQPPAARVDVQGGVAWLNLHKPGLNRYDDWVNQLGAFNGSAGWYWTDHFKTEIDAGVTSTAEWYAQDILRVNGQEAYRYSEYRVKS